VEEADYFKAEDKYTLVVTKEGESLIRKSIRELAQELDPGQFWQIHRGPIVNVSKIDKVSRSLTGRGGIETQRQAGASHRKPQLPSSLQTNVAVN
jgi:DNA-binding LytR/AlgR family response regulator